MIINSLQLENFGIYYNTTIIDFTLTNPNNTIILFGGENGSGKTTILQAIKLALYGSLIMGYRTNGRRYNDFLFNKFNRYALEKEKSSFSITLNLTIKYSGIIDNLEINRRWNVQNQKAIEHILIKKNGEMLGDKGISDTESFIRKYFPPALFDFFFFDGEGIREFTHHEDFEKKLKESALTLFNLDLFSVLTDDLNQYLLKENIYNSLSQEEKDFNKITEKIENLTETSNYHQLELIDLKKKIEEKNQLKNELESEFKLHGGLVETEITNLKTDINNLEHQKKLSSEWLKEYAANTLPFLICKNLLLDAHKQINDEKEVSYYRELQNQLNTDLLTRIHQLIESTKIRVMNDKNEETSSEYLTNMITDELTKSLKPNIPLETFAIIHNLSQDKALQVSSLVYNLETFDLTSVQNAFNSISNKNMKIYTIRNQISTAIESKSLDELWEKRTNLEKELHHLHQEITEKQLVFASLNSELEEAEHKSERLEKKILQANKDRNAFVISKKIEKVLKNYIQYYNRKKIKEVEHYFIQMFTKLIRKDNFVDRIKINDKTFKVELFNSGKLVPSQNFSAGEKQLYILSLLWAFLKASNRQIPLVFDTLLGRLDHSHKASIIKYFLPNASEQTIILSTDTEIDQQYYKMLKPNIGKEYLLEYNEQTYTVNISQQYFLRGDSYDL